MFWMLLKLNDGVDAGFDGFVPRIDWVPIEPDKLWKKASNGAIRVSKELSIVTLDVLSTGPPVPIE